MGNRGKRIAFALRGFLKEVLLVLTFAIILSLLLKSFVVQTFWIPSASMNNTLVKDDRISVSLFQPRFKALSRGDIVVFLDPGGWLKDNVPPRPASDGTPDGLSQFLKWTGLLPNDSGNHLVKRVIGVAGDHVVCCNAVGQIVINGKAINETYLAPGRSPSDVTFDITVPPEKVWIMGDNRSNSSDSRMHDDGTGGAGSVPISDIVGRAVAIVWPLSRVTALTSPAQVFEVVDKSNSN